MRLPVLTINELFDMLDAYMANGVDLDTPVYFEGQPVYTGDIIMTGDDDTGHLMSDIFILRG